MKHPMKNKKTNTLLIKFAIILFSFGFIIVGLCGVVTYIKEYDTYTNLQLERSKQAGVYIRSLIYDESIITVILA